ncbi:MAG TPA: hypothetical protein VEB22_07760 [Phycisphaerales bacterium]|nr:hypothetical protein [Phycisphaerales bacterium]
MLAWMTIVIAVCAGAGAVLVFIGLRGRTVDSHPVCRRCGFDLRGRFPWGAPTVPACPDCGQPLLTHKSVRPGAKVLRPRVLAFGCMLCFPAVVISLAMLADTIAGGATASIKPTGLISAQLAGTTRSTPSLRKLTGRVASGVARAGDIQPAVERALTLLEDRGSAPDPDWLEFLEVARRRGELTLQQTERYFRGAIDFGLVCRPTVARGRITFALQAFADRLAAPDVPLFITIEPGERTLAQRAVEPDTRVTASGSLAPRALMEAIESGSHAVDEPGTETLEAAWTIQVHAQTNQGPLLATWIQRVSTQVTVAAPQDRAGPLTGLLTERAETGEALVSALALTAVRIERKDGVTWASFSVTPGKLPADLVATLHLTTPDGREYSSTTPILVTPSDPRWGLLTAADPAGSPWRPRVQLDGYPVGTVADLRLIPQLATGLNETLAAPLWAGPPIEFKGVQLLPGDVTPPSGSAPADSTPPASPSGS